MVDITADVGENAANKSHDVAIVQAMLRVIRKNKVNYLGGSYDGAYGGQTKRAIIKFQKDYNLIDKKGIDKEGKILPNGETLKKMNAELPAAYKKIHIMPNTKTVYLAGSAADAAASKNAITGNQDLEGGFRVKVGQLVEKMYKQHKIVLTVTSSGWRRTFAEQAVLNIRGTGASPGHSNHNYGRAVDIGFNNLQWLRGNGRIVKDDSWLNLMARRNAIKAAAMWDARDTIALNAPISLYRLQKERIHLQSYNQATVDMPRSLSALLNLVGKMKWAPGYKCDLGANKQLFSVGSAKQIWAGRASVSQAEIAKAKGVPFAKITGKDITAMRAALKADFQLADQNWIKWKPIP